MRIRIRIQQLKLMRIHADPDPDTDPDPKPCIKDFITQHEHTVFITDILEVKRLTTVAEQASLHD